MTECLACLGMPYREHSDNCGESKSQRRLLENSVWGIARVLENKTTITGVNGEIPWAIFDKLCRDFSAQYAKAKQMGAVQ